MRRIELIVSMFLEPRTRVPTNLRYVVSVSSFLRRFLVSYIPIARRADALESSDRVLVVCCAYVCLCFVKCARFEKPTLTQTIAH